MNVEQRIRDEVQRAPGWITARVMRYRFPKGTRLAPALARLEREGVIRQVPGAWWSPGEPVYERTGPPAPLDHGTRLT